MVEGVRQLDRVGRDRGLRIRASRPTDPRPTPAPQEAIRAEAVGTGAAAFAEASCTLCRSPVAPGLVGALRGLRGGPGEALLAIPFVRYRHLGMGFPVSVMRVSLGGALTWGA